MKKKWLALLLVCTLALNAGVAMARSVYYGQAVIDGGNADRVHLRDLPSTDSKSLGLYFTGTEVMLESNPEEEWVAVAIGQDYGYIKSEYLIPGEAATAGVKSRQPTGYVSNPSKNSWLNLRSNPSKSGEVLGQFRNGDAVLVLGETSSHWYYVLANGQYGYMAAEYLSLGKVPASGGSVTPSTPSVPSSPSYVGPHGYQLYVYTQGSSISIQYPRFTDASLAQLNTVIENKVRSLTQTEGALAYMNYQSAVTLDNDQMVSIIFWGESNVQNSMHPTTDLYALNVELSTLRELSLTDLYAVDDAFVQTFFRCAYFPTNPITSYDVGSFGQMLAMQDTYAFASPESITFFLKPTGLVLSLPAVHATGSDHFEAEVQYADVAEFSGQNLNG